MLIVIISGIEPENAKGTKGKNPTAPADDWFEKQRAFPFDEIPNEEYLKAIEYKKRMPVYESDNPAPWILAGPTNIEGRITTIAIHPSNPQIVYAGTANGGLWKSTNFCQSWFSVFNAQNTSSIGSVAIDPLNPEIIYCGTGESNSLRSYYPGTGIYKSTNGGSNWVLSGLPNSYSIGNICVNPLNPQEIYAASVGSTRRKSTERGIYKSINGGLTWSQSLFIADSVGAIDAAIDPLNPNRVFAAMWERQRREDYIKYGGPMTALYLTTNSGAGWNVVAGGFPSNSPDLGRISLDISYSNPQIVYALTAYTNGNNRGLYKSSNGGLSWSLVNSSAGSSSNYAWFNRICKVDPADPNEVYCGGLNMQRSTNGGSGFISVSASHVDQHAAAFAPSNPDFVVIGNDGGIDYSSNGGLSWSASTTLPITQFYAGEIDYNNPSSILGGTQDNGTIRTGGGTGNWNEIYGGDGFYCLIDYSNSQRVYAASQNGGLGRSTNGGASFISATSGLDLTYTNWMTPYVMDKSNPQILYCGTYKVHKTTNGMQSWSAISPDMANGHFQNLGTITTLDVAASDPNVIYCGTDDANVWVTTNGGGNWIKINNGLPYRWVTRVTVHPNAANICYVTLSGYKVDSAGAHVFKTTNFGANWISISGNLPDAPANDILVDPLYSNILYLATDVGVMISINDGLTWSVYSQDIPSNVPCHDLTIYNPTRKMVVWTHGRSAYIADINPVGIVSGNENPVSFRLFQNYPNPFNPVTRIKYTLGEDKLISLKVYDINGRLVKVLADGEKKSGEYEAEFNGAAYSSGVYFYRLTAGNFRETRKMLLVK